MTLYNLLTFFQFELLEAFPSRTFARKSQQPVIVFVQIFQFIFCMLLIQSNII